MMCLALVDLHLCAYSHCQCFIRIGVDLSKENDLMCGHTAV